MFALSVSISTSSSPLATSSPSDLSHLRIVPSSIESDRRGIATSPIAAVLPGYKREAEDGSAPARASTQSRPAVGAAGAGVGGPATAAPATTGHAAERHRGAGARPVDRDRLGRSMRGTDQAGAEEMQSGQRPTIGKCPNPAS